MLQLETTYFNRNEYTSEAIPDIFPGKLRLATTTHIYYLDVKDIVRIQSLSNYSKLFFRSGQTLVVAKVLAWFEQLLPTHHFFRVHRTHLVNLSYVEKYIPGDRSLAAMSNNEKVPVSRRKKKVLKCRLNALVQTTGSIFLADSADCADISAFSA
jgi:DNA-binding LytR/AlgR family response regulator